MPDALRPETILQYQRPSLCEERDGRLLLIWGDLARWLVADSELARFAGLFNGKRPFKKVLKLHARRQRKKLSVVEREALPVVNSLEGLGILTRTAVGVPHLAPAVLEPVRIANVTINLTNRCNLACPWCYNASRRTGEVDASIVVERLEEASQLFSPGASLIILGGEPTLDMDRLEYVLQGGARIFQPAPLVSTNGTQLTAENVATLARQRVEVQVSLDGATADEHDSGRGQGVFDLASEGICRLRDAGVHTTICMVYGRESMDRFEPYLDLALSLGASEARFIPLRLIGRGAGHADSLPDQFQAYRHLVSILRRRPELARLLRRDYFSITSAICRFSIPRSGCGIGRKVIFIDADGTVYPCPNHVYPELACGNIADQSLADIVHKSPVMEATRKRYQVTNYTRCQNCTFRHWCAGDCRGEVLSVATDPLAPSPHCQELRSMMLEMFWAIAGGDTTLGPTPRDDDGKPVQEIFR